MKRGLFLLIFLSLPLFLFQNCGSPEGNSSNSESPVVLGENVSSLIAHPGPLSVEEIEKLSLDCEAEVDTDVQFPERGCFQFVFGESSEDQAGTFMDVEGFDVQDLINLASDLFANVELAPEVIILINGEASSAGLDMSNANFNLYLTGGSLNVGPSNKMTKVQKSPIFLRGGRL